MHHVSIIHTLYRRIDFIVVGTHKMHLSNFGLIINYMETGGKRQWNADNVAGTGQCKVAPSRETKAEKSRLSGFVTH